jgi:hypothetical protein
MRLLRRPNLFLIPLSLLWLLYGTASEPVYVTESGDRYTMEQVGPNHYELRLD